MNRISFQKSKALITAEILIFLFSLLYLSVSVFAEEVNIAIASVPTYPQMEMENRNGGNYLVYELVKKISKAGGLEPKFHFLPFKRTIHAFINDNVDFLIGFPGFITQFGVKPDKVNFVPMMITNMQLFCYKPYHQKGIKFSKLSDLDNYLIGIIRGSPLKQKLTKAGVKSYELDSHYSGFMMLKEKRVDLLASVQLAGKTIIKKYFPKETYNFAMIEKPVECKKFGILTKNTRKSRNLRKLFKKGLKRIIKNGEYEKLFKKYWGEKIPPNTLLK